MPLAKRGRWSMGREGPRFLLMGHEGPRLLLVGHEGPRLFVDVLAGAEEVCSRKGVVTARAVFDRT